MTYNTVTGQREDYVLVPRKPTKEMLEDGWYGAHDEDAGATWRLMIEAYERALAARTCQLEAGSERSFGNEDSG